MDKQILQPSAIADGIFAWLIHGDARGNTDTGTQQPLPPEAVAYLIDGGNLLEPEIHGIWCYARLLARHLPDSQKRMDLLRSALNVPDAFDLRCRELDSLSTGGIGEILDHPSETVIDAINALVIDWAREHTVRRTALPGLSTVLFQHPSDRLAMKILMKVPFLGRITGAVIDDYACAEEVRLLSSAIEVTEDSLPDLHALYRDVGTTLGFSALPPFYVEPGGINAYTTGDATPYVVLATGAASLLSEAELRYVLGHELGHVMAGHVKFHSLANLLAGMGDFASSAVPILGDIGNLAIRVTLIPPLQAWARRAELTADRAGLLACQDREAVWSAMMKLMGFPPSSYDLLDGRTLLHQAERYRSRLSGSLLDRLNELSDVFGQEHPRMVIRVVELLSWMRNGSYDSILACDKHGRESMARGIADDPDAYDLLTGACTVITDWASREYRMPGHACGALIRTMIHGDASPEGTPLEPILHIELHIRKEGNAIRYGVVLLIERNGTAVRLNLDIPWPEEREYAPAEVREEMFKLNRDEVVRLLYTLRGKES